MVTQDKKLNSHVNLNPGSEDCYYYFYSKCSKGDSCHYRHSSAALGNEEICSLWKDGSCTRAVCAFRHAVPNRQRSSIPCYWENQASGCTKIHCPFLHLKTRPVQLPSVQERIEICNMIASAEKVSSIKIKSLDEILAERPKSSVQTIQQVENTTSTEQLITTNFTTGINDDATRSVAILNDDNCSFLKPKKKITINRKRPSSSIVPPSTSLFCVTKTAMCKNQNFASVSSASESSVDILLPEKRLLVEETKGCASTFIAVRDQIKSDMDKFAKQNDDFIIDNDIEELLTDSGMREQADDSHNDDDLILELEEFVNNN